jgi:hypothetical protein
MEKLIEAVTDEHVADSLGTMVQGQHNLDQMHREAQVSGDSSVLAKTVTSIASDSAQKAVAMEVAAPTTSGDAAATQRQSRWGLVGVDVTGALTGAATAATILAVPGRPAISLGIAVALGPLALLLPPLGAIIGSGMTSGAELRRTQP